MAEPPLSFLARLYGSNAPLEGGPGLPPLARGYLPDYATGMELPPMARGQFPPLMALGAVRPPQDQVALRTPSLVPHLPDRSDPPMRQIVQAQNADAAPGWSETLIPWRDQSFPGANPARLDYLGRDPEGRSIESMFHAGTLRGGVNKPLGPMELNNLTSALTAVQTPDGTVQANYRSPNVRELGSGALGEVQTNEVHPEAPIGFEVAGRLPVAERQSVGRHEAGHALHRRIMPEGMGLENMDQVLGMAQGFTGDRKAALRQMQAASYAEDRDRVMRDNPQGLPQDLKMFVSYSQKPSEIFAENFRAYTADPAAYKTKYPEAAAMMRAIVNTNPRTNKLMTLSRRDDERSVG